MIIDGHQHVLNNRDYQKSYNIECGIDKVVLFPTVVHPDIAETKDEFAREMGRLRKILKGEINPLEARIKSIYELAETVRSAPDYFIGFGSCPYGLDMEKTAEWIESYILKNGFRGVGELTIATGNVAAIENIFRYIHENAKKLPVWIHTFNPLTIKDIAEIAGLADKYNTVKVILGHSGGENWLETIDLVKDKKNMYMDISASFTTLSIKYISQELPERCVFSSDLPYGDPLLGINQIEHIIKDKTVRQNVLGLNTMRMLDLSGDM